MNNNIIEYLGIDQEFYDSNIEIVQEIIDEVETAMKKYLNKEYAFHDDVIRFYDKKTETINIIEKLNYITIFEIKSI